MGGMGAREGYYCGMEEDEEGREAAMGGAETTLGLMLIFFSFLNLMMFACHPFLLYSLSLFSSVLFQSFRFLYRILPVPPRLTPLSSLHQWFYSGLLAKVRRTQSHLTKNNQLNNLVQ